MTGAASTERPVGRVHVYVGPTLTAQEVTELCPEAIIHPPVAHGDLLRGEVGPADVVVIIDGFYHQRAPVRHKEILQLLADGTVVIGCSSMGALRAAELYRYGMIGYGRVFELFRDGVLEADDEVAVTHLQSGDFRARNLPLVNLRHLAGEARTQGVLADCCQSALIEHARSLHYTDRLWATVMAGLREHDRAAADALESFAARTPGAADLKGADARQTLRSLPVLLSGPANIVEASWQNRFLFNWVAEFQGGGQDEKSVGAAELVRHLQLYREDFPALWCDFVTEQVAAELGMGNAAPADVARRVFERANCVDQVLADDNELLTPSETRRLTDRDRLVYSLVRGFEPPRGAYDLRGLLRHLTDVEGTVQAIRQARRINDEVRWRDGTRLVERLSDGRLRNHLAVLWALDPDERTLTAAARDRGFPTLAEAVAAVRPYFLRDDLSSGGSRAQRWKRASR